MLQYLKIKNLALLEVIELEFQEGFTAITGETGAGKSVLIGALNLLAGERADKTWIRQGASVCEVEGLMLFTANHPVFDYLITSGLPECESGQLIVRRMVYVDMPSRAWINGALVSSQVLKNLAQYWIDFHGPDAPQRLADEFEQRLLLDTYGSHQGEIAQYHTLYIAWQKALKAKAELENQSILSEDEKTFYQSQLDKIQAADVSTEAIFELEKTYDQKQKQEDIEKCFYTLSQGLSRESGVASHLGKLMKMGDQLASMDERYAPLNERLEQLLIEVDDLSYEYAQTFAQSHTLGLNSRELEEKMNRWLTVKRAYGPTLEHVLLKKKQLEDKLMSQEGINERLAQCELDIQSKEIELKRCAQPLHEKRLSAAQTLVQSVQTLLPSLGLPKAQFKIQVEMTSRYMPEGMDHIQYMFSSNVGQNLLPLGKIASSGEIARVMLALKVALAAVENKALLIFDEVDANVGGEVAKAVGQQLSQLGRHYQVLAVTHLPQVAAQAQGHIVVEKIQTESSVLVNICVVTQIHEARLLELSRMLGDRYCPVAQSHAQELLTVGSNLRSV